MLPNLKSDGHSLFRSGQDVDAGVFADPVHVVGHPGVHVREDLRLAASARHEGGHAHLEPDSIWLGIAPQVHS